MTQNETDTVAFQGASSITPLYPEGHAYGLNDDACLWRYVPLRTLLFYLTGNAFIPSVETLSFSDPFEGKFHLDTTWFNQAMMNRYGSKIAGQIEDWIHGTLCNNDEKQMMKRNWDYPNYGAGIIQDHYFAFLRKTRYAWCWFHSEFESASMWNNYGKYGVAVATTVGKLKAALAKTNHSFTFGQMRYVCLQDGELCDPDFNPENPEDAHLLLMPYFLKRHEYKSESEVRFVTTSPDDGPGSGIVIENLNPIDWIIAIHLWPGLKPLEANALTRVVGKLASGIPCGCSDLFGAKVEQSNNFSHSVMMHFQKLQSSKWKDGGDNIPAELKVM